MGDREIAMYNRVIHQILIDKVETMEKEQSLELGKTMVGEKEGLEKLFEGLLDVLDLEEHFVICLVPAN
jgi:hypothetical protein